MAVNITKQGIINASGDAINKNLAINSLRNIKPNSDYNIANFALTQDLTAGVKYTCTIKGIIGESKRFGMWMGGGYTQTGYFTDFNNGLFILTFTAPTTIGGNGRRNVINIYAYPSSNTNLSSLEWLKIEEGETATPWIPASVDISYVGDTCGFTEIGVTQCSIGREYINSTEFIEI